MAYIERRVNKDKSISYRAQVKIKGYPLVSATLDKLSAAKEWATNIESAIRERRYFKNTNKHTFNELVDRYIETILVRKKPKSARTQHQQLLWWKNNLGNYHLNDITTATIVNAKEKLLKATGFKGKLSAGTVNQYLAVLNHAFNIAIREWGWLEVSPMKNISRLKEPRGRIRYLTDTERVRLLDACKESSYPDLYTIVVLALSTGARKMEILGLKWEDVHEIVYLDTGAIILHDTKNGEIRRLPLVGKARELLNKKGSHDDHVHTYDYVFYKNYPEKKPISIEYEWKQALKKANIKNFRFHDLRHSAASYLAMNGASPIDIAKILGHKSLQMVSRYSHLSESHTTNVVSNMNKKIFEEK